MNPSVNLTPLLVSERELARLDGLSRGKRRIEVAAGRYPPPVKIGPRKIAWRLADVTAWCESLPRARP